jgi:hypothetical protein
VRREEEGRGEKSKEEGRREGKEVRREEEGRGEKSIEEQGRREGKEVKRGEKRREGMGGGE